MKNIVISFSRLFDSHKDAVSLLVTLDRFSQNDLFKNNGDIKATIICMEMVFNLK